MEPLNFKVPRDYATPARANHAAFAAQSRNVLADFSTNGNADHTAILVGKIAEEIDYAQGGETPIEASRFTEVKEGLSKIITEGISGWVALGILTQTIKLFQTFSNLYEAIRKTPIKQLLPFNELLFPLSSFYIIGKELLANTQAWQEIRGTEEERDAVIKVAGNVASCLLYAAQIIVFFLAAKVTVPIQVILSTVIYASSFFQLFKSEFDSEASQREKDMTPPKFALVP